MSETDDTDELLLIPPDLFVVNSELEYNEIRNFGPFYNVVDSLISQLNNLENRVNYLQNTSEVTLVNSSLDQSFDSCYNMDGYQRFKSSDEAKAVPGSTQSTPQKPKGKFVLNSLPSSPNMDRFSPRKTRNSPDFKQSNMDNFLTTVKNIKRVNAARNLEKDFNTNRTVDLSKIDEIMKNIQEIDVQEKTCRCGDDISSVPDYGLGMRHIMHSDRFQKDNQPSNSSIDNLNSSTSTSSSEPTQNTAINKFTYTVPSETTNKPKNDNLGQGFNLELVSLSNLWKSSAELRDLPIQFQQKLQEEKLRRQHCEQLIQQLQTRTLELQERLAVAVQVDEAKDSAIMQFHEAWEKLSEKLHNVKQEKYKMEQEIAMIRQKTKEDLEKVTQKVQHYEEESLKTLNLDSHCRELELELENYKRNFEEIQNKYLNEMDKNKKFPEIIAEKEIELNEGRMLLNEARKEVIQCKKTIEECQKELSSIKNDNTQLNELLTKEKQFNAELNEEKKKFINEIEAHKNIEIVLQDELNRCKELIKNNQIELKNFYQGQVELVVETKLRDFQYQLEKTESSLIEELKKRELAIAKKAAFYIQQMSEKNDLEIKLLEERHHDQISLHLVKLAKSQQELEAIKQKMQRELERNNNFYRQVAKFVESVKQDQNVTSLDQLESFKSKSYCNLEEMISNISKEDEKITKSDEGTDSDRNSQLTYRVSSINDIGKFTKSKQQRENEVKNFIDLLLDKPPGNPIADLPESEKNSARTVGNEGSEKFAQKRSDKRPWK